MTILKTLFPQDRGSIVIFAAALADLVWVRQDGWTLVGLLLPLTGAAILFMISFVYSFLRPAPVLGQISKYSALWICLFLACGLMSYLVSAIGLPLKDPVLAGFDATLGFHWIDWANFVATHPTFFFVLNLGYASLGPQIFLAVIIFSVRGWEWRNKELLQNSAVSALLCCLGVIVIPAVGPWAYFANQMHLVPSALLADPGYLSDILKLRSEQNMVIDIAKAHGIVCFPSFHTAMAVVLIYAYRNLRWWFPPILALNVLMLLAIPLPGAHYLTDMFGGAAVACLAIWGDYPVRLFVNLLRSLQGTGYAGRNAARWNRRSGPQDGPGTANQASVLPAPVDGA